MAYVSFNKKSRKVNFGTSNISGSKILIVAIIAVVILGVGFIFSFYSPVREALFGKPIYGAFQIDSNRDISSVISCMDIGSLFLEAEVDTVIRERVIQRRSSTCTLNGGCVYWRGQCAGTPDSCATNIQRGYNLALGQGAKTDQRINNIQRTTCETAGCRFSAGRTSALSDNTCTGTPRSCRARLTQSFNDEFDVERNNLRLAFSEVQADICEQAGCTFRSGDLPINNPAFDENINYYPTENTCTGTPTQCNLEFSQINTFYKGRADFLPGWAIALSFEGSPSSCSLEWCYVERNNNTLGGLYYPDDDGDDTLSIEGISYPRPNFDFPEGINTCLYSDDPNYTQYWVLS